MSAPRPRGCDERSCAAEGDRAQSSPHEKSSSRARLRLPRTRSPSPPPRRRSLSWPRRWRWHLSPGCPPCALRVRLSIRTRRPLAAPARSRWAGGRGSGRPRRGGRSVARFRQLGEAGGDPESAVPRRRTGPDRTRAVPPRRPIVSPRRLPRPARAPADTAARPSPPVPPTALAAPAHVAAYASAPARAARRVCSHRRPAPRRPPWPKAPKAAPRDDRPRRAVLKSLYMSGAGAVRISPARIHENPSACRCACSGFRAGRVRRPGARAETEDPTTAVARSRFKEGVDFYDKGQYEQARASFLQAYALKKHPAVLLNLAWSCLKSGHALEAEHYFKQFLSRGQGHHRQAARRRERRPQSVAREASAGSRSPPPRGPRSPSTATGRADAALRADRRSSRARTP